MSREAELCRRLVDEAAQLGLHVVGQTDRPAGKRFRDALLGEIDGILAAAGDPLGEAGARAEVLRGRDAPQPATSVTRAQVAHRARDALDHGSDVEGVGVPLRWLEGVEHLTVHGVADRQKLEAGGGVAPDADAGHEPRARQSAGQRGHCVLIAELQVERPSRRVGAVAVARQTVTPREERGPYRRERPLAGALAQQDAEILAGVVLVQSVAPGSPCSYGARLSVADRNCTASREPR